MVLQQAQPQRDEYGGLAAQIELRMPDSHMQGSLQAANNLILAPGKDARPQHPPLALQKGRQA